MDYVALGVMGTTLVAALAAAIVGIINARSAAKRNDALTTIMIASADDARTDAQTAARKVREVKETLAETTDNTDQKLDGLAKVALATHTLVNSAMSEQLRLTAVALRRIADLTEGRPSHAQDLKDAEAAEGLLKSHQAKQGLVDAQPGTDREKSGKSPPTK